MTSGWGAGSGEVAGTGDGVTRPVRWAVVGGGMLGAVAAYRLRRAGAEVVLLESAPSLGGLTSAWQLPVPDGAPVTWDRFYHVILGGDRRVHAHAP